MRISEVHDFFPLFSLIKFLTLIYKNWNEKIFENWDSFPKFFQFFCYKWEFLANFGISEKIEKIETIISENLKISLIKVSIFSILSYGPPLPVTKMMDRFVPLNTMNGWWCSGTYSGLPCWRSEVRFPHPPILEKCAKGSCLCNLLRSTQPNDQETVIEGLLKDLESSR